MWRNHSYNSLARQKTHSHHMRLSQKDHSPIRGQNTVRCSELRERGLLRAHGAPAHSRALTVPGHRPLVTQKTLGDTSWRKASPGLPLCRLLTKYSQGKAKGLFTRQERERLFESTAKLPGMFPNTTKDKIRCYPKSGVCKL